MSEPISTVIADDEPLARRQLRSLLERDPQIVVVGEAGTGLDARRAVRELEPNCCCWMCGCREETDSPCSKASRDART